ncbi:hypothetical protein ANO11243_060400 [Dothideomycetidae sp. 11243]|nr:hypothetical protein ANO11243_060400 [fungal sp. No.11243]
MPLNDSRKKRKAEALAQQIFGKNRKAAPAAAEKKSPAPGGSLASRMGVNKRSASSSSLTRPGDSFKSKQPSALSRSATAARLETALADTDLFSQSSRYNNRNKRETVKNANAEISIRGAAGPYTVVAQNFAPGTTAADIESVMQPVGGELYSCKLVASKPTVIAELMFMEKHGADAVIETFNNKKADGRLLHVYLKLTSGEDSISNQQEELVPISRPPPTNSGMRAFEQPREEDHMVEDTLPETSWQQQEPMEDAPIEPVAQVDDRVQQPRQAPSYPVENRRYDYDNRPPRQPWQDRRGGGDYRGRGHRGGGGGGGYWRNDNQGRDYWRGGGGGGGGRPPPQDSWGPRNGWN